MNDKLIRWVLTFLHRFSVEKGFGSVTFFFENGKLIRAKVEKSEKPDLTID